MAAVKPRKAERISTKLGLYFVSFGDASKPEGQQAMGAWVVEAIAGSDV